MKHWLPFLKAETAEQSGVPLLLILGAGVFPAVIAVLLIHMLTPYGAATSPDSVQYLTAARNFHLGHGLLDIHGQPFTKWPPLYPFVLSLFVDASRPLPLTASYLAMITLPASVLLLAAILSWRVSGPVTAALALVYTVQMSTLTVYTYAFSESLFIVCILAVLLFSILSLRRSPLYLVAALVCAALATYTRYLGIFFLVPILGAVVLSDAERRARIWRAAGICIGYGIAVAPIPIRNYMLSGYLTGMSRVGSSKSLVANVADTFGVIHYQIFAANPYATGVLVVLVVLAAILAWRFRGREGRDEIAWLSGATVLSFVAGIIILRTWKRFDTIDIRLLAPICPYAVVWLAALGSSLASASQKPSQRMIAVLPFILLAILSSYNGVRAYGHALSGWRAGRGPEFHSDLRHFYRNYTVVRRVR